MNHNLDLTLYFRTRTNTSNSHAHFIRTSNLVPDNISRERSCSNNLVSFRLFISVYFYRTFHLAGAYTLHIKTSSNTTTFFKLTLQSTHPSPINQFHSLKKYCTMTSHKLTTSQHPHLSTNFKSIKTIFHTQNGTRIKKLLLQCTT